MSKVALVSRMQDLAMRHGQVDPLPPAQVPDILYHYTDAAGLVGMLSSGGFWVTDYRFLNDKSEIYHTEALIRRVVAKRRATCTDEIEGSFFASVLEDPSFTREAPVCFFSLSEDRDSLSQWRGYAQEGQGFTIGFKAHEFLAGEKWSGGFDLKKVEYNEVNQTRGIRIALDELVSEIPKWKDKISSGELVKELHDCFRLIAMGQSTVNKHASFQSEREWRIVAIIDNNDEVLVRARRGQLVPYIPIKTVPDKAKARLPISCVGIGPGFSHENQLVAVEALCKQFGYNNVDIYQADSPFRQV